MHRFCFPMLVATAWMLPATAPAQTAASEFSISKVDTAFQESPNFPGGYLKRVQRPGKWLEIEVAFAWSPRAAEPRYLDDLSVNFYVLTKAVAKGASQNTLLTGTVHLESVGPGKDLKTVMYVSPRALLRLFDGKVPSTPQAAIKGVGVTLTQAGQVVARHSTSGSGEWWAQMEGTTGILLSKPETPFAALAWDYYEPVKDKPSQ